MSENEFTHYKFSTPLKEIASSFMDKFNVYKLNFPETESDISVEIINNLYEISLKMHQRDKELNNFGFLLDDKEFALKEIM